MEWQEGEACPSQRNKALSSSHLLFAQLSCKDYINSKKFPWIISSQCRKQCSPPFFFKSSEEKKNTSKSPFFMGTKAKHMRSICRMQMPQAAAFLSSALSKWPFRLNCSSQHSPIKNGHQQGKGYLLIHKRYERQYLFCLRFLFTCLGENRNSWNSLASDMCVYLICWLWARQVHECISQSQTLPSNTTFSFVKKLLKPTKVWYLKLSGLVR